MPACSYEVTARSAAPPEKVFALLADALTWPEWARPIVGEASWVSEGTPPPGGVGAVRKVGRWPMFGYEQIVASEPPTHHAYTMVKGNPVKNYRADVYLAPDDDGTKITWGASFDPKVPGTGAAITAFYRRLIGSFAQKLARYAERMDAAPIEVPPRDSERPQDDPWDADAVRYLLGHSDVAREWTRNLLIEHLRGQHRLKEERIDTARTLAGRFGVECRREEDGTRIHFYRTDDGAPRYPESAHERQQLLAALRS